MWHTGMKYIPIYVEYTTFFSNANFYLPQSFVGTKNCKSGELIRQSVTKQHYFAPLEA